MCFTHMNDWWRPVPAVPDRLSYLTHPVVCIHMSLLRDSLVHEGEWGPIIHRNYKREIHQTTNQGSLNMSYDRCMAGKVNLLDLSAEIRANGGN